MKLVLFVAGMLVLLGSEILRVYFIMPFPGSQESNTIDIAYFLQNNILYLRTFGGALAVYPAIRFIKSDNVWIKWPAIVVLSFWLVIVYAFNFRFLAEKIFYPMNKKTVVAWSENKVPAKQLVLGVTINGESRAYPIEIIGYHHQVRDKVGGEPIMVTYCTVCRTGRVYSPKVDGKIDNFRLVGMDHYNAMFEDNRTKSWWRQVNGEAVTGPLKGKKLNEIPSEQMTLEAWAFAHPETKVLQPDSSFLDAYKGLEDYDEGKMQGRLESKDSLSWRDKSWIVGVQIGMEARAYDWIELNKIRVMNDVVEATPLVVLMEPDSATFHTFNRVVDSDTLSFSLTNSALNMMDSQTNSIWNWNGTCIEGAMKGTRLQPVQSYQEYWHSWKTFRPHTTKYTLQP